MLFNPDLDDYERRVVALVGPELGARLRFIPHGQHNHEGPDTSGLGGPVNREYFEYLLNTMAEVAVEAVNRREPAQISFGQVAHSFGVGDGRDPLIWDKTVRVLRAHRVSDPAGTPIVTFALWNMHPEVTLGYSPAVPDEDCVALGREPGCSARGQYFSGDFPGIFARVLKELQGGGEVLYLNSAIGSQIGPRGPVWEVSPDCPIEGDGSTLPPGCTAVDKSFRKAFLIGQQLAIAVANTPTPNVVPSSVFDYRETYGYSRITNPLFKIGLCPAYVRPDDRPLIIGYNLRDLFVCDGEPSDATCVSDEYRCDGTTVPQRHGQFARVDVRYVRMGQVQFVTMPGEFSPELSIGVPADFDTPEGAAKYFNRPDVHYTGPDFVIPGTIHEMLNCSAAQPCWSLGLTVDEMGYVLPIVDFWCSCLGSEEECHDDYLKGATEHDGAMSASDCELVVQDIPAAEQRYTDLYGAATAQRVIQACLYGQLVHEDSQHYEESVSGGWNGADDYFKALSQMLNVPISGRYQRE